MSVLSGRDHWLLAVALRVAIKTLRAEEEASGWGPSSDVEDMACILRDYFPREAEALIDIDQHKPAIRAGLPSPFPPFDNGDTA
jgi:hypothetical protein